MNSLTLEQVLIAVLLVISLGTIWNYLTLKKEITNYWKIAKPDLSKQEIRNILDRLSVNKDIEELEKQYDTLFSKYNGLHHNYENLTDKLTVRIGDTLQLVLDGYNNVLHLLKEIFDKANTETTDDFIHWLNDSTELLSTTMQPFDDALSSWPEFIDKEVKDETQV